jgi:hydrogenase nickel incorporation protein HypB
MIARGIDSLPLNKIKLLFIENVGNLVCPAEFALGEHLKVLVSHTPEGDDKPFKYPLMFQTVDAAIVNKTDLLPYVKFNLENFTQAIRSINSRVSIFPISCNNGEGISSWVDWLERQVRIKTKHQA